MWAANLAEAAEKYTGSSVRLLGRESGGAA